MKHLVLLGIYKLVQEGLYEFVMVHITFCSEDQPTSIDQSRPVRSGFSSREGKEVIVDL